MANYTQQCRKCGLESEYSSRFGCPKCDVCGKCGAPLDLVKRRCPCGKVAPEPKQRVSGSESVYQSDRVIENAYEFIDGVGAIVGFFEYERED